MLTVQTLAPADRPSIVQLMCELQGHLAAIDPLKRIRSLPDFDAETYVDHLLEQVKEKGVILLARDEDAVIGFIAGTIPSEDPDDMLDHYSSREGKIIELVVSQKHRGQGAGRMLMEKIEEYFKKNKCEYIRVGCFASNIGTHAFYEKCGYANRYIEMLKKIA